jgi:hypothetical protein
VSMLPVNRVAVAFPILAAIAGVLVWWGPWRRSDDTQGGRGEVIAETIEERRAALADRVARYFPANPVKLDDLAAQLALTLRALPGVARVDTPLSPAKPRQRIVQPHCRHVRRRRQRRTGAASGADGNCGIDSD